MYEHTQPAVGQSSAAPEIPDKTASGQSFTSNGCRIERRHASTIVLSNRPESLHSTPHALAVQSKYDHRRSLSPPSPSALTHTERNQQYVLPRSPARSQVRIAGRFSSCVLAFMLAPFLAATCERLSNAALLWRP